ncbi:DUF5687 family protein [Pareuzebyella sediminis]|uniref:DUF5687 family protein n=1 Tax=Pareuzebyella sediminis TaxID=2607998 RepID=UPI0011EF0FE2|nr:DUF5687 family protein [Pareuzebyella sediminis]
MFKHFIILQWKSFIRSASFKANLMLKIFMGFMALYFIVIFTSLGIGSYYLIEKQDLGDPLQVVNKYLIYYLVIDLAFRYAIQKMPITNIKPLLYLPITTNKIVHFSLVKTAISFFNLVHSFFFVPFSIVLVIEGYAPLGVIGWHLAMMALFYSNNFLNVLLNNKDSVLIPIAGIFTVLVISQYYGFFDITVYMAPVFQAFYNSPWFTLLPWALAIFLYFTAFTYFKKHMYLDAGLSQKKTFAKTEDFTWLDRFGSLAIFLKNDIKLIKRNKRSKMTVLTSILFLFYGLLFFTGAIESYDGPVWKIFAGIFISGGFLFTFGQFVPSWDSSYYPLLMSQNITYKDYLNSKWYLVVIATLISTLIAAFYLYFGWDAYLAVLVGAVYNMGVNSYLVLWGGAYIKTPIDLTSNKKAFGDKQSFNLKTMLLTMPKLVLPLMIYGVGHYTISPTAGYIFVVLTGIAGFAFKNYVFKKIEKIYKKEKYKTLLAYKQAS